MTHGGSFHQEFRRKIGKPGAQDELTHSHMGWRLNRATSHSHWIARPEPIRKAQAPSVGAGLLQAASSW